MTSIFPLLKRKTIISGEILSIRIRMTDERDRFDEDLLPRIIEVRSKMREEFEEKVKQTLGQEFEIQEMNIRKGSIEIIVLIGAAYVAISRYKNFIDSIELLVSQLKGIAGRFMKNSSFSEIKAHWLPESGLISSGLMDESNSNLGNLEIIRILLWYLIISHAALLGTALYLILRGN